MLNAGRILVLFLTILPTYPLASASTGAFGAPVGSLSVGYRSEWIVDGSRHFDVPVADGTLRPGPRYIHVHLCYPCVPNTGRAMNLRGYFGAGESGEVPKFIIELIAANDFGTPTYSFQSIYHGDATLLNKALDTAVAARAWAQPAAGKFPVVLHIVGQNDFTQDAVLYAEYLASRGYIVVTIPYLGTSARRSPLLVHDASFYENLLRDAELALTQKALKLKCADESRVFATGHSYGGIYALLLAMRMDLVKAVIGLDPTYISKRAPYELDLSKTTYWDPNIAKTIITLRRESQQTDYSILNALPHALRIEIVYANVLHGDYASVPFFKKDLPTSMQLQDEIAVRSPAAATKGAAHVYKQVAEFLDVLSKGANPESGVISDPDIPQRVLTTAAAQLPTPDEVYWLYRGKGIDAAIDAAKRLPERDVSACVTMAKEEDYYGRSTNSADLFRIIKV